MTLVTPEKRAHLASIARLGGLAAAARNDTVARSLPARTAFHESFLLGHGCKVCKTVTIPADLPDTERQRRATALRALHFGQMARARR